MKINCPSLILKFFEESPVIISSGHAPKFIYRLVYRTQGVFYATTIWFFASFTTSIPCVPASGRKLADPSIQVLLWGLALHNIQVTAVPEVRYDCVVA